MPQSAHMLRDIILHSLRRFRLVPRRCIGGSADEFTALISAGDLYGLARFVKRSAAAANCLAYSDPPPGEHAACCLLRSAADTKEERGG